MSFTSQSVLRTLALLLCTTLFAGIWRNDVPKDPGLAQFLPPDQRTFHIASDVPAAPTSPQPMLATYSADATATARPHPASSTSRSRQSTLVRSVSIDATALLISPAELAEHLRRLPLGLAAGEYRIVDSLGGVGWLRITDGEVALVAADSDDLLTSTVKGTTVRFIRIQQPQAQSISRREQPRY